ncbi:MAG TPA: flagellar hook capping protein [Persephonella sp.]|uniref:Basal-body rod modification protein FlgD n=1 Tax=Persephonella marina (strain DSM 14350 / EX-H1) TaxID=123214 RepID=C0QPA6_PERMH|nr:MULTISPECIES: FlgD immunoglobulin-like domain containing protein [Persephonella]ACO03981.1 flagellar hook capping protein FlgD [Persephonella marina EX-H1]HCB69883.1 flagellar hook capping protein [Persephonella sp.]
MESAGIYDIQKNEVRIVEAGYDNSKMENEDFLKVLLADLQWQDPLQANDITDFIQNTVKLREMEVLNSFQETVELLKETNEANSLLYASGLIGKKVVYEGNQTFVENGRSSVSFRLDDNADIVTVTVMDKQGNVVETESFSNLQGGVDYPFEIDNPNLTDGYYTVYIEATKDGSPVKSSVKSLGLVESVVRESDGIKVLFDDINVDLNSIVQIGG